MPARPLIDRVLSRFGLSRTSSQARSYAGAQVTRLTQDWFTTTQSADQEIKSDLARLRGASRSLVRDNAYAKQYVKLVADNVVGPYGIKMQSNVGTVRGDTATSFNAKHEKAWRRWGKRRNCTLDTRLSWTALTRLVCTTLPQDGEVFLRKVTGADNEFGFALQMIDADRVDHTYTLSPARSRNGNGIVMGVEIEMPTGKPVAYWTWSEHPSDFGTGRGERVRIPADEMIHIYVQERVGQTRGVPWFAPVLFDQKMMAAYQEAEITAARIGASNVAGVVTDPDKYVGDATETAPIPLELEPGSVWRLNVGESLVSTNFDHPSTAFSPFMKSILRSIAAGLGVSYTALTGDLEAVNYSSIRAGLLQERDGWCAMQEWLTEDLCERVHAWWLPYAALSGFVSPAQAQAVDADDEIVWQPRGWDWVDPLKDIEAAAMAVREGFATRAQICASRGDDFTKIVMQLAGEQALAASQNVTLGTDAIKAQALAGDATSSDAPARALRLARGLA